MFGVQPIDEAGLHYHATEGQSHQHKKHRLNHTPLAIADRLGWQWRRIGCMSVHHKHIGIRVAKRCHFHNKFSSCLKMFKKENPLLTRLFYELFLIPEMAIRNFLYKQNGESILPEIVYNQLDLLTSENKGHGIQINDTVG